MTNTPTKKQVDQSNSWKQLYEAMGVNPKNDRACRGIQSYVRSKWPNSHLERRGQMGRFSDEEFTQLVVQSPSKRELIVKGGWVISGSSYTLVNDRIKKLGLDTSHMLGQAINRGSVSNKRRPISEYLVKAPCPIGNSRLKRRLWEEGLKDRKCETCGVTEWMGKPAPFEMDHKNGDKNDNRLQNLRILCCNCHAQTPTWGRTKSIK